MISDDLILNNTMIDLSPELMNGHSYAGTAVIRNLLLDWSSWQTAEGTKPACSDGDDCFLYNSKYVCALMYRLVLQ